MQMTPQSTWNPWKPVVVKKTEPNKETCGLKPSWSSFQYSTPWIDMKTAPKSSVRERKSFILARSPRSAEASACTIVTEEQIRMKVFMAVSGTFNTVEGRGQRGLANLRTM